MTEVYFPEGSGTRIDRLATGMPPVRLVRPSCFVWQWLRP
jgi:hypothetical protein